MKDDKDKAAKEVAALSVDLREYIEALFKEKDRALTMASEEREKAAQVLRQEQHRAIQQADAEREKAASALREGLARAMDEGDERLREHIENQIQQIRSALESSELLEIERVRAVGETLKHMIEANTREFRAMQDSAQAAVQKAEEAQGRVNESQNQFRGQLADQAATLMPRRESEGRHDETGRQIRELRDDLANIRQAVAVGPASLQLLESRADRMEGSRQGSQEVARAIYMAVIALVGLGGFILAFASNQ